MIIGNLTESLIKKRFLRSLNILLVFVFVCSMAACRQTQYGEVLSQTENDYTDLPLFTTNKVYTYLRDDGTYKLDLLVTEKNMINFRIYLVSPEMQPDREEIYFSSAVYSRGSWRFECATLSCQFSCTVSEAFIDLTEGKNCEFVGHYQIVPAVEQGKCPVPEFPKYTADLYTEGFEMDAGLACGIRESEGLQENAVLTKDMLAEITSVCFFENKPVTLTGLSNLVNLESLRIGVSWLTDISGITALPGLKCFDLGSGYVTEIPDLSSMAQLEELQLTNCLVKDISPVASAPALRFVALSDNRIISIAPLRDVHSIEMLNMANNCVLDYETIADNQELRAALKYNNLDVDIAIETVCRAKTIITENVTDDMSDLEKEYAIYRYIIDHMEYEVVYGPQKPFGYTALVEGKGVCMDYAEGFALLCQCAGINALNVISDTHAWNMVKLGENWYHVDTLWDENNMEYPRFFNRGTEYIMEIPEHTCDLFRYPEAYDMSFLQYGTIIYQY